MEKFEKNVDHVLPYDRKGYWDFLDEDVETAKTKVHWYGLSLQLESIRNQKLYLATDLVVKQSIKELINSFRNMVAMLDDGSLWIVNHDDKDMDWFLDDDAETLPDLHKFFLRNNIPNSYRGCFLASKAELIMYAEELVTYAYVLSYKNLDISHSKNGLVIKLTGHLTIDLLSTKQALLTELVAHEEFQTFVKIPYR